MKLLLKIIILTGSFLSVESQQTCAAFTAAEASSALWSCDPSGRPYYYSDDQLNFDAARAACQALTPFNGKQFDIVVIETQAELDFIVADPAFTTNRRYIGLQAQAFSDPPVMCDYKWLNGAPVTLDFPFDNELPTNPDPVVPRCVFLDKRDPPSILQRRCTRLKRYICEVSAPYVSACEKVKTRFFQIDEGTEQLSFEDAQTACMENDANLITVKSLKENMCAFDKYVACESSIWLGLVSNLEKNKFHWIDNDISPYRNWCSGVSPAPGTEGCILLRFDNPSFTTTGCFELVEDCVTPQSFVCEANTLCDKNGFQTLTKVISKIIQGTKNDCKSCRH
ncbi:macrophage mannose receptor 1-like [Clytia hemisphaerica]